jgi:membrane protease YdiL (CAAX protease family)
VPDPPPRAADVEARPSRWGLGDALAAWLVGFVVAQIVYAVIQGATGRTVEEMDDLPLGLSFLPQLGLWVGLLLVPLLVVRRKGNGAVADLGLRAHWPDLWRGGAVGAGLQVLVIPLLYWPFLELLSKDAEDLEGPAREITDKVHGVGGVVLIVVWVAILTPIAEEVFYRGLLLGGLRKRGLAPWAAIGLSSLLFAASHLQGLQFPALFVFGVGAAVLVHRTGRLGPAIAAHMAFNAVTVVALLA